MAKKIAIIGARGINNYGGFETTVGEIAPALVKKGFDVYCSCEKSDDNPKSYKGANLIYFPIKMSSNYVIRKILEIIYDIYFNIYCTIILRCDVVYSLGVGANIFVLVPRIFGKKSMVNIDGLEWRRNKFSIFERFILKLFFYMVLIFANYVVVDSNTLKNYINPKYSNKTVFIPYGVGKFENIPWDSELIDLEIAANDYFLVVARLEPENNIHLILNAYILSNSKKPLVIVGDFVSDKYLSEINDILEFKPLEKRIIFTGGIYDPIKLNMLRQNCFAYVHGHSVGGTNPSLLEILAMKKLVLVHMNPFNMEVCDDAAIYFKDINDLRDKLEILEKKSETFNEFKEKGYYRVKNHYSWTRVVKEYELLFNKLTEGKFS